jgi:predicted ArsR family transcriptional regulator
MTSNLVLILILLIILVAPPLFRALRPKGLRIEILWLLKDGPKSAKEIAEHLGIKPNDASMVLHFMEHATSEAKRELRPPWDSLGNLRPTEVFLITSTGKKLLELELDREKACLRH